MTKPTVVVTRAIPREALAMLAQRFTVDANDADRPYTREELISHARDAEALVTLLTDRVDDGVLAACPKLKVVANVAVGYDNIDIAAATRRGVVVTNTPDVLTDATADFAWTLILAVTRRLVEADRFVRTGAWAQHGVPFFQGFSGAELAGRTLGIAGFGRIGQAVARRGGAFGMRILYANRRPAALAVEEALAARRVDKATLLADSDVLSLHLPLTAETRGYVGPVELAAMKPSAYLINTARGPIVDEAALVEALRGGAIRGAGLDVFEREPTVEPGLLGLDNVVLAPHIGSATVETRNKMAFMAAENAIAVAAGGAAPNPVR